MWGNLPMKLLKLKWVFVKSLRILFNFIFCHVLMEFMLWKAMFDIFKWSGNDRQSWSWVIIDTFSSDFQTIIVSDRRSWFGKMIVSDRRSRKKVSSLTLYIYSYILNHFCSWMANSTIWYNCVNIKKHTSPAST